MTAKQTNPTLQGLQLNLEPGEFVKMGLIVRGSHEAISLFVQNCMGGECGHGGRKKESKRAPVINVGRPVPLIDRSRARPNLEIA